MAFHQAIPAGFRERQGISRGWGSSASQTTRISDSDQSCVENGRRMLIQNIRLLLPLYATVPASRVPLEKCYALSPVPCEMYMYASRPCGLTTSHPSALASSRRGRRKNLQEPHVRDQSPTTSQLGVVKRRGGNLSGLEARVCCKGYVLSTLRAWKCLFPRSPLIPIGDCRTRSRLCHSSCFKARLCIPDWMSAFLRPKHRPNPLQSSEACGNSVPKESYINHARLVCHRYHSCKTADL